MRPVSSVALAGLFVLTSFPAAAAEPAEFLDDAKLLSRIVACAGDAPLPEGIDAAAVAEHCQALGPALEKHRTGYVATAGEYLAKLRPAELPPTVVYPFGGGDLVTALTTFPGATELTTISLEHGGDPRRVRGLKASALKQGLKTLRPFLLGLLSTEDFSRSQNLKKMEKGDFPGQLSFFLVALAVHGYEPVSLRYFRLEPDGTVHYFSAEEIAAAEKQPAQKLKKTWAAPNFSEAFSNVELGFRKAGDPAAPVKLHRHFAWNLGNDGLRSRPALLAHLDRKGKVAVMTKAASYLLWIDAFSTIRGWLLSHTDWMISDSSGIPPKLAVGAGFVQESHGTFTGAYLPDARQDISQEMVALWKAQPVRPLSFRFGYPDVRKHEHLLVMRRNR